MSRTASVVALVVLLGSLCSLAVADDGAGAEHSPSDGSTGPEGFSFDAFTRAFGEAFAVILATEIGDRTFFIAAIMAMRHSRFIVWAGAVAALVVMTVLATLVGHVAPLLISRRYTQYAAAGLFLFFGVRMLRDGLAVDHTGASEELDEVEAELTKKQEDVPDDEEAGEKPPPKEEPLNKILMQAFTLTFLAEWGDRSQIATIALVSSCASPCPSLCAIHLPQQLAYLGRFPATLIPSCSPFAIPLSIPFHTSCDAGRSARADRCHAGGVHWARALHRARSDRRQAAREQDLGAHGADHWRCPVLHLCAPCAARGL